MNAKQRKQRRDAETALRRDARAELEAATARIARLEEDLTAADTQVRTTDEGRLRERAELEGLVAQLRHELAAVRDSAGLTRQRAIEQAIEADALASKLAEVEKELDHWRAAAREWEEDAKDAAKLRRRLARREEAAAVAPLNRKAAFGPES